MVKTSAWLSRFGNLVPFDNAKLIEAAFSEQTIHEQLNSEIIEVNDSLAIVLRVNEYQAAKVKSLSEVSQRIKTTLIAQKASEKTLLVADELLTAFKAGNDITEQLSTYGASFEAKIAVPRYSSDVDKIIANEAFKLAHPVDGAISATTVNLNNGDFSLVEVQAVKTGESEVQANFSQQHTQQLAQSAYQSYVESLRSDAKITQRTLVNSTSQR